MKSFFIYIGLPIFEVTMIINFNIIDNASYDIASSNERGLCFDYMVINWNILVRVSHSFGIPFFLLKGLPISLRHKREGKNNLMIGGVIEKSHPDQRIKIPALLTQHQERRARHAAEKILESFLLIPTA